MIAIEGAHMHGPAAGAVTITMAAMVFVMASTAPLHAAMQSADGALVQKPGKLPTQSQLPASAPIRIEAQALDVGPSQESVEAKAAGFYPGGDFLVRFTMKNTGSTPVHNVPWSIHDATTGSTLAAGMHPAIAPNAEAVVAAKWRPAEARTYKLQGYVDPSGAGLKNTAPVSSQVKERDIAVRANIVQWNLTSNDWPGAVVVTPDASGKACAHRVWGEGTIPAPGMRQASLIAVSVDCLKFPLGSRVTIDAFKGVTLKNGWKVVSAHASWSPHQAVVNEVQKPAPNTADPYFKVTMAVDGHKIGEAHLSVVIEGPAHLPYK